MNATLKDFISFFKIDLWQVCNYFRFDKRSAVVRTFIISFIVLFFVLIEFVVFYDLFKYIMKQESLGELRFVLIAKLLNMVFLIFTALLIYSNIIMSISAYYTSDRMDILHSKPTSESSIFLYAFFETFIRSSWMFIVFGVPVLFSFGMIFNKTVLFISQLVLVVLPLLLFPTGLGVIIGVVLMLIFSPTRTRRALFITGLFLSIGLVLLFRWMQPETIIDPIGVEQLTLYLNTLRIPTVSWLPSTWAAEAFFAFGEGRIVSNLSYSGLLWFFSLCSFTVAYIMFRMFWWRGRSGSHGGDIKLKTKTKVLRVFFIPDWSQLTLLKRDILMFLRDPSQWTQLIIISALITIYVYNFKNLPYALYGFQYSMSFVSLGATGLILSAISARFAYPSVSLEGKAFWILQSAPINWKRYLWHKFFINLIPTLTAGLLLILFSLIVLDVSSQLMYRCITGIVCISIGMTGLAVGLGAIKPKFAFEDAAQIAVSTGGLIFMIWSIGFVGFVLVITIIPDIIRIYVPWRFIRIFRQSDRYIFQLLLVITTYFVTVLPMRLGIRHIETHGSD